MVEIVINQRTSEGLFIDDYLDELNFCRQKVIDLNNLIDTCLDFVILVHEYFTLIANVYLIEETLKPPFNKNYSPIEIILPLIEAQAESLMNENVIILICIECDLKLSRPYTFILHKSKPHFYIFFSIV